VTDLDHIVAVLAAYVDAQEQIAGEQINLAIETHKQSNETKCECPTVLQILQCMSLGTASSSCKMGMSREQLTR